MSNRPAEHGFETREQASAAIAGFIADALRRGLAGNADASLVVSGGSSPAGCFAELAKTDTLELAYLHLQSMNNFSAMAERAGAGNAKAN